MKIPNKFDDVLFGVLFLGLGQMVLFLAAPKVYMLLSQGIETPDTSLSVGSIAILVLLPMIQSLLDTVGALGMSFLTAASGIGFVFFGWREFLRDKIR